MLVMGTGLSVWTLPRGSKGRAWQEEVPATWKELEKFLLPGLSLAQTSLLSGVSVTEQEDNPLPIQPPPLLLRLGRQQKTPPSAWGPTTQVGAFNGSPGAPGFGLNEP